MYDGTELLNQNVVGMYDLSTYRIRENNTDLF